MGKIAPGSPLSVRNLPGPIVTQDAEVEVSQRYLAMHLEQANRYLATLYAAEINKASRVEEYAGESIEGATGETILNVTPDFAPATELITEVLVTGPVTTAFVLQLGNRYMTLSTDATGKCLLSPVQFAIGPNAQRQLTSATNGSWFLHLAGYALLKRADVV